MSAAFRWVILRHLRRERGRTLLTVAGVALGVGVFVAVRLASTSALASFTDTVDAVAGRANLELSGSSEGFDERAFAIARRTPSVLAAAPVIEVETLARPGAEAAGDRAAAGGDARLSALYPDQVLVLGVDVFAEGPFDRFRLWAGADSGADRTAGRVGLEFLRDPRGAAITRALADRHGLRLGDTLTVLASGRPVALRVRSILESQALQQAYGGNVVIVDIATAQERFHRLGRLDRVDLIVDPARHDATAARLRRELPAGITVETSRSRSRQVEHMVRAFELNLTALSFIALFVSSFLIFNAVAISVARRRREIGVLRALGARRAEVAGLFLMEGAFFGVSGGVIGLAVGRLLAHGTLGAVSRTLSDLYRVHHAGRVHADLTSDLVGFGLGVIVALASALAPALEAATTPAAGVVSAGASGGLPRAGVVRAGSFGGILIVLAGVVALWTVSAHRAWGGFASAFLLLAGGSLLAPAFTLAFETALAPLVRRVAGVEGGLGTAFLRGSVARTSVVVAALMVAVGMWVALATMVGSFRRTVDTWVRQSIRGDLYVEPVGHRLDPTGSVLPDRLVAATRALPRVVAVDTYRGARIVYDGRLAWIVGIDFDVQARFGRLSFTRGATADVLARARAAGGAIVSESFAHHHDIAVGDRVRLDAPAGAVDLPVTGIFYDYSTDAGVVMVDRALYARLYRSERTESMAVYLAPGADLDAARAGILAAARPGPLLSVTPNQALRRRVLEVFDQTFRVTYALEAIAILVAVLGVISTLTALILQRRREVGILRACGAMRRQVVKMVLVESGLLGLIGAVMGCLAGFALAWILVHVINTQYFGWTIRMRIDPGVPASAVAVMVLAATAAGLAPARLAAGRLAAEAVRSE